jgi:single-strand DNA-binding protein
MANLNKVMLIGRLTRDPEIRTFANGGKVAAFGFAVNNRKKNQATGEWEDDPCFLDVKAFNRETGRKLADLVEQYLHKGNQAYLEGHLVLEQWEDKNGGGKRSKLVVVVEDLQFLEPRQDGGTSGSMSRPPRAANVPAGRPQTPMYTNSGGARFEDEPDLPIEGPARGTEESDIPF